MTNLISADNIAIEERSDLVAALEPKVDGEVRFDQFSRLLYATDASLYQVMPVGVVIPKNDEDVLATLEVVRQFKTPIIARGAGSSLEGQTTGAAIILDTSKYMHHVLEVDAEARQARVQPGVVLDTLNKDLAEHGLMFGPDPASSNRATFGGMIGNNSTGAHSILYGMTHDHVKSLRVLLADGTESHMGELTPEQFQARLSAAGHEGDVYRTTQQLAQQHREEIEARYPKHWRAVSGYGLDRMVDAEPWNLAQLLVGSEGTLALTLDAKIKLVPRPAKTALAIIHFKDLLEAMDAVPRILEVEPSAIELIDDVMIELTRKVPDYARQLTFVEGNPACILIIEFYGDNEVELDAKLSNLQEHLQRIGAGYSTIEARSSQEIANVWGVRKAGLGLLMSTTSQWKPIPFIEDGSVPPEQLTTFVREVQQILEAHEVESAIYAHASAGCLHIRPMLNLKRAEDVEKMRSITDAWGDVIVALRGSFSGEHGDGRARSEWNEKLFGSEIYRAFVELKDAWDPEGLLNPGNIVRGQRMTENLRYGADYQAIELESPKLSFENYGSFTYAVEMCSGIGVCRKTDAGVMCPSYIATRDEEHSTRGRANALRGALAGRIPQDELFSKRMYEVLDLCLECKACAAECPTQVDMAAIKYEYLHHYYEENGLPLRNRLFGNIRTINRLGSALAPVSNWMVNAPFAKLVQKALGVAPERRLPPFAQQNFYTWFDQHKAHNNAGLRGEVALYPDTFTLYNYPEIGIATAKVLEAAGYSVSLPQNLVCCGRPMISKGMLDQAERNAEINVAALLPYAERRVPIIGIEPSCLLTFRDEAPQLLRSEASRIVAEHSLLIDEWLMQRQEVGELDLLEWQGSSREILLHGHCHHKASGIDSAVAALNLPPGYEAELIDAGCCGMAGSFGFEQEHYEISQTIGEDRLFPTLRENAHMDVAVTGVSCRQQIEHIVEHQPRHLIEWLADDLLEERV
ncbi:MAG: FAD-binding oxidoreductase [Chloroflexi bacterium]|nr:MAG: FAD-binding oxidoreductase [Chloroflexota bacterium]MBL1194128.1 FAD-binding oxidoreductase [Chloroflexota bacterium]NOH11421.1 FAD-binding protein [Chloroflexota bacterium]